MDPRQGTLQLIWKPSVLTVPFIANAHLPKTCSYIFLANARKEMIRHGVVEKLLRRLPKNDSSPDVLALAKLIEHSNSIRCYQNVSNSDSYFIEDIRDQVALWIDILFSGIESDWPWPAEVVFRTLIEYGMHRVNTSPKHHEA